MPLNIHAYWIFFLKETKIMEFLIQEGKQACIALISMLKILNINVENIKRAIYSHTFLEPINHFPDCSPPCVTNSSTRPLQFLEYLLVTREATKVSSEIPTLQAPKYS